MKVTRVFKDYPEKNLRKRKWFSVYDAAKKVEIDELATIIRRLGRIYNFLNLIRLEVILFLLHHQSLK